MGAGSSRASGAAVDLPAWCWSLALALLLLWPALGGGFALSRDMVWVPDLALRPGFLGVGSGLPRAVPSDAVVAVLDELVPGALLQDLLLVGAVTAGGAGAARLPGTSSTAGRLAAATAYAWNPFVAERLVIGHWPVLLGYAVLPWLVQAGREAGASGRLPLRTWVLLPVGSLSAGAGVASAAVLAAFALRRGRGRAAATVVAAVVAANAPWLVSGALHAPDAVSAAVGGRLFALDGAGALPGPLAALALGGVWNADVVLDSRETPLAVVGLAALLVLAALGVRGLRAAWPRRDLGGLAACWALGWGLAVLTWAAPGAVGWLAAHLPGAGVLRDGARFLALCAPLVAALVGQGVARAVAWAPGAVPRAVLATGLVLVPVAVLPDAAGGASGRLRDVRYPSSYAEAAARVEAARAGAGRGGAAGDAVLLPFTAYRAPAWNGGRSVLDPAGRYLPVDYVAADDLVVSGTTVPGEDPRARAVGRALASPDPDRALAGLGVGFVVTSGEEVSVRRLDGVVVREPPAGWVAAMVPAWAAFAGAPLAAAAVAAVRRGRGGRTRAPRV